VADTGERSQRSIGRVVFIVSVVLTLVACCGGITWWIERPGPEVRVGAAPQNPTRVVIDEPASSGVVPGSQWPRACSLISDDELHAVLSQATAVKRQPAGQKFKSALGTNSFEVPEASCQIEFDLPGNGEPEHANVHVTLDFVGSEFYVKQNYDDYGTEVALPGADMCHRTSVAYKCRKGGVDFTLSGGVTKDVNFAGQKGAARAFYVDRVLVEYVKLILAKLP
jgi:hypothetical protein